jgi:hypothetical protein
VDGEDLRRFALAAPDDARGVVGKPVCRAQEQQRQAKSDDAAGDGHDRAFPVSRSMSEAIDAKA